MPATTASTEQSAEAKPRSFIPTHWVTKVISRLFALPRSR